MKRLSIVAALLLSACTGAQVQHATGAVAAACANAMPLAQLATPLPVAGPFIAAGVTLGCTTDAGLAKLAADPNSAAWLDQQAAMLRAALARAGIKA